MFLFLLKGASTYIGAAPIVECLEKYQPDVIITSRVADAALFLAPMVRIAIQPLIATPVAGISS